MALILRVTLTDGKDKTEMELTDLNAVGMPKVGDEVPHGPDELDEPLTVRRRSPGIVELNRVHTDALKQTTEQFERRGWRIIAGSC